MSKDKNVLLSVADGPEHIEIYTSEEEGVVDWASSFPAVYLTATVQGVSIKLGPFELPEIYKQLKEQIKCLDTQKQK